MTTNEIPLTVKRNYRWYRYNASYSCLIYVIKIFLSYLFLLVFDGQ